MKRTIIVGLVAIAGTVLAFAAGSLLLLDLFFDEYPDTILDHPVEAGVFVTGVVLIVLSGVYGRRTKKGSRSLLRRPEGRWGRVGMASVGVFLVTATIVLAFGLTAVCGFGCTPAEYWGGLTLLAALAVAGLWLSVVALTPPAVK